MRFKSTHNIFVDFGEVFDDNWMNHDTIQTPPNPVWDYSRPLQIEDVDIWEVIYEQGGGMGVYASWCPYAEFYLIRTGWWNAPNNIETYYGPGSESIVIKRMAELGIKTALYTHWVEPEDMWLYQDPEPKSNTLILP